jgi:hypothetical protein
MTIGALLHACAVGRALSRDHHVQRARARSFLKGHNVPIGGDFWSLTGPSRVAAMQLALARPRFLDRYPALPAATYWVVTVIGAM